MEKKLYRSTKDRILFMFTVDLVNISILILQLSA
jgi:hypothetical protein